uniref:Solute-binding protein family 3/N-terminal domain-containing protein n=1 Tax=Cuerna arida TaxID=1464854 RepID=A0A1B6EHE6_9HEMI
MSRKGGKLRLVTYMCPSHPVELYELIMSYLEESLDCEATLMYESRAGGGPLPDRVDPFTDNSIDIAFMTSSALVKLLDSKNQFVELLPVAAVFKHPQNKDNSPGYYSDVIIHIDGKKHVKEFLDLRGCRWAYSDDESLSGSTIVLKTLRELGENATFFGNAIKSGSHLASVQMVLQKQAEAAAVDSNTLAYNKVHLQDRGKDLFVLESLGPLPPYPIVVNSRLPGELKSKLSSALLKLTDTRLWGERISKFGVTAFKKNNIDEYELVRDLKEAVQNVGIGIRYY